VQIPESGAAGAPDAKVRFLEQAGAGATAHSKRTLLEHLLGVRDALAEWKARTALVDAGLFHSAYGTEFYRPTMFQGTERARVRAVIGAEAEQLAYLWSRVRRASLARNLERESGFSVLARPSAREGSCGDGGDDVEIAIDARELADLATLWAADTLEQVDRLGGRTRHQPELYALRHLMLKPARRAVERVFAERPFAKG
jgi:hypothetical protein